MRQLNKNDFVVVNGKRYYADGGNPNYDYGKIKTSHWGVINNKSISPISEPKKHSETFGNQYFTNLSDVRKRSFLDGRDNIEKFIIEEFANPGELIEEPKFENYGNNKNKYLADHEKFINDYSNIRKRVLDNTGIDLVKWRKDTNIGRNNGSFDDEGFDNANSRNVYKHLASFGNNMFTLDNNGDVKLGANVVESTGKFRVSKNTARRIKEEQEALINAGIPQEAINNDFERAIDNDGNKYFSFFTSKDDNGIPNNTITVSLDKNNNIRKMKNTHLTDKNNRQYSKSIEFAKDDDENSVNFINNWTSPDGNLIRYNSNDLYFSPKDDSGVWKDYNNGEPMKLSNGGHLNRYYADGGAMGQIPLGEQMPEDYNMVGEGGMHEENPMGGVPYGINQDGSQNMVEEGEVSVGDNVYSNRTQLSPELCQQLGLPEGTTPAEAMQQIEQLYEQGQLSDEEFQEVQEIIFQDQESQKQAEQGVGGSYQQGMVGGPGVQPQGMPMDNMQMQDMQGMQGGMPMDQIPQNEGITPDMVQGGY